MSKYRVQFGGRCWKTIEVEAESLEDAKNIAREQENDTPWTNIDDVECYGVGEAEDDDRPCQACRATGMRVDELIKGAEDFVPNWFKYNQDGITTRRCRMPGCPPINTGDLISWIDEDDYRYWGLVVGSTVYRLEARSDSYAVSIYGNYTITDVTKHRIVTVISPAESGGFYWMNIAIIMITPLHALVMPAHEDPELTAEWIRELRGKVDRAWFAEDYVE